MNHHYDDYQVLHTLTVDNEVRPDLSARKTLPMAVQHISERAFFLEFEIGNKTIAMLLWKLK